MRVVVNPILLEVFIYLERSQPPKELHLGPDHPHTLMYRNNFADAYQAAVDLSENTRSDESDGSGR